MALPGDLAEVVVTGSFVDPAGTPLRGTVSFVPNVILADPGDSVVIAQVTRVYDLSGGSFTATLLGTDAAQIVPQGWAYNITVSLQNTQPYSFTAYLPSADSPLDISELVPLEPVTQMTAYLPLTGGTMTGPLYAAQNPAAPLEVATMGYVESVIAGLNAKEAVQAGTAAALPPYTATPLTLTANFTGTLVIDTVTVALGDRVLVKNETSAPANNGIYVVSQLGTSMEPWILTRSSDMDTAVEVPGAYTFVQMGSANAGFGYIVEGTGPVTLGTTAINWEQFTSTGEFNAAAPLVLSGQTVSLQTPLAITYGGTGSGSQNWTGLLTPVSVTQSSGTYAAAAGSLVKADISGGSWTIDLPHAPAANTIVGAKVIANVAAGAPNILTVACASGDVFEQSGGATTATLFLLNQAAAWQYNGGYWTRLSGDLPLGQLDDRYQQVFSPIAFGAKGDGITDDTEAVQAAFAAATAAYGTVYLGSYSFLTSAPITLPPSALTVSGAIQPFFPQNDKGRILNNTTDMFNLGPDAAYSTTFQDVALMCGTSAGHVFNFSGPGVANTTIRGCYLSQLNPAKSIFYVTSNMYACSIGHNTTLECSPSASVPPVYMSSSLGSAISSNYWDGLWLEGHNMTAVPFFHLESTGNSWQFANSFRNITAELCAGGLIRCAGAALTVIENVWCQDASSYEGNIFSFIQGSGGSQNYCMTATVRNSGIISNGDVASGYYHVYCTGIHGSLVLQNVGHIYTAPNYSVPAASTIILGEEGLSASNAITFPAASVTGLSSAVAAGTRLVGATASGAPATGTWTAGDVSVGQNGALWIYNGTSWLSGGTSLNVLPSGIQPDGTQAAGGTGLGTDAGHVHPAPASLWVPSDNGWLIANGIIAEAVTPLTPAAGTLYLFKWKITAPVTIGHLVFLVDIGGSWSTTVAPGSNGGEISQVATWSSPSAGVLDVASTAGWPASGTITVATTDTPATVTYTGTAAGQFTGCAYVSGSATGTVATGYAVANASPSGSYIGLFSSSGTLLTGSSDISSLFVNGGWQNPALTTPQSLTAGTFVWAALLLNMPVMPKLWSYEMPASIFNANQGPPGYRFAVNGTGLTSLASITPSSNVTSGALPCFCGGY